MKTTQTQRDALRMLHSKTSQGKWQVGKCLDGIHADKMCLVKAERGEVVGVRQLGRRQCKEVEENAAFIVEAHNILLDLLDDAEKNQTNISSETQDVPLSNINDYYHSELEKSLAIMYMLQDAEVKYNFSLPEPIRKEIHSFTENFRFRHPDQSNKE